LAASRNDITKRSARYQPPGLRKLILTKLIEDAEQRTRHEYCVICGVAEEYKRVPDLQQNHIGGKFNGRSNFEDTITVCSRCHDYLSDHQKTWLNSRREVTFNLASYLCGWSDVFELLFSKTGRARTNGSLCSPKILIGNNVRVSRKLKRGD
jgi:hypothetical protein